jgi:hypothetical protein
MFSLAIEASYICTFLYIISHSCTDDVPYDILPFLVIIFEIYHVFYSTFLIYGMR